MDAPTLNGRYKIQKRLSKKGARQTLLAQDLTTRSWVVIKLLLFGDEFKWEDHKLFERGAGTLKALSHPGIPRYLDYFDVDLQNAKGFAQVQAYIPAKSLQEHLKTGRTFSETEVRQIARDLLNLLVYLQHRQPAVIHRDIKPSNILLDDRSGTNVGTLYLVDFDSVQVHTAAKASSTMTVVGTYGYMPPEQFGGQAVPASDLYSLGATLIYVVTGKHPAELPQDNLKIQFESFVNLSPDLTSWLRWMTHPDLKQRLSSAEKALQTLDQPDLHPHHTQANLSGAIAKPDDSNIILRRQPESLEVLISSNPLGSAQGFIYLAIMFGIIGVTPLLIGLLIGIGAIWALFSALISFDLNSAIAGIFFLLGALIPLGIGVGFMLPLFCCLPRQCRLWIDANQLSLTHKILFLRNTVTANRRDLRQLVGKSKPFQIILIAKQQRLIISTRSAQELEWLGQELSLWLKIPVTQLSKHN